VVRDIWKKYGKFDEIHVELGREMKNTAEDRAKITNQVTDNENTNLRIKMMLMEFANDDDFKNQKDYTEFKKEGEDDFFYQKGNNPVRPYSQTQHDILKIFEEYVLNDISKDELEKETGLTETKDGKTKKITYKDISQKSSPSNKEVEKYKLWLEQKYSSPYTGQMIPLSKLFTPEYQIEHIIPKSRYFDDSLNNKVICEAAVNQLKDKQLGLEFIKNHKGQKVDCGMGKNVEIFTEEAYTDFVKEHYKSNNAKRRNLLLEDIPDKMIARQMNDTRYISKFISNLLSNIVREETDDDGINSKNLISVNGKITTILKQDWGLNEIWNSLILPRFERMNELTQTNKFIAKNSEGHTIPAIPLELSKGFQKKRIDHRHHAMDALVIACATRDHVNYLNNQSSHDKNSNNEGGIRYDLKNKLCFKSKTDEKGNYKWIFKKPWGSEEKEVLITTSKNFVTDAKEQLEKIVVSFKQNLRVINKATNKYEKIKNDKKEKETQKGTNWAIRKPLHKETVYAKISLRKVKSVRLSEALKNWQSIVDKTLKDKIKQIITQYGGNASAEMLNKYFKDRKYQLNGVDISKVEVYYFETDNAAVRKSLDKSFTEKTIKESVTDTGIQKILLNHLAGNENNPELAFSPEGIENMNKNIVTLNDGKFHQPIYKVRVYETIGNKFPVGTSGNKSSKFVEAAKGTNLFFAVYADKNDNRNFETIPLNIVIERLKQGLPEVPETNEKGHKLLFHLSPNDLVYVPTVDEKENNSKIDFNNLSSEQLKRIYKLTDTSGTTANFIQANIAEVLFNLNAEKQKKTFGKQIFSIQNEIGVGSQGSKNPKAITGETIKEICIKLKIDRLGNINPLIP
jgi:CRISPR-associated endonuclease Csn1